VANYYLDTSALVKRYLPREVGAGWVQQITDPTASPVVLMSAIGIVEVAGALARKEREHEITAVERQQYLGLFVLDCQRLISLLPLTGPVLRLAATLTQRQALRAYDAVHLASALSAHQLLVSTGAPPLMFVAADGRLCRAAQAEGLRSDDPLAHP
jgi:predicted nucleic acid-binding protein